MLNITSIQHRDRIVLSLILVISALMCFSHPGVVEFFHDDAMLATLAQEMVDGETFPVIGILSSVGIPNPPTSVYVMAIPFAISSDPMVAILFVMLLNVAGTGLLWLIAHRYFGRMVGLIAGLSYAMNPWAILYSRKIWAQDFHTPFILLGLLLGLYGFCEAQKRTEVSNQRSWFNRQEWAQAFCLPVLLFGMQIHFASWALLPIYLLLIWAGRLRVSFRAMALTLVLSGLVMLPYGIGLKQTLDVDPARIRDAASRSEASAGITFTTDSIIDIATLTTGLGMEKWVSPDQVDDLRTEVPVFVPLWIMMAVFLVVGVRGLFGKQPRSLWLIILIWAFLPPMLLIPSWTPVYGHYFIASIPALSLLTAIGVVWLNERLPFQRAGQIILFSLFGIILLTQGIYWNSLMSYVDQHEIAPPGFSTPFHYLAAVREELAKYNNVVVISHGMHWLFHHEAAVWQVMLHDTASCVRTLQGDGYAVLPDEPFAVMIAPDAPDNPVNNLYKTDDPVIFPVRPDGGAYEIHVFQQAPEWAGKEIQNFDPVKFESGVLLVGYAIESDRLLLEWQLPAQHKGLNYQYSGQLLNTDGERIVQQDTVFWHGRHWCDGDRLITWTNIDIPADISTLRVSLYELGQGQLRDQYFPADVLDELGNPAGQWIDIRVEDRQRND